MEDKNLMFNVQISEGVRIRNKRSLTSEGRIDLQSEFVGEKIWGKKEGNPKMRKFGIILLVVLLLTPLAAAQSDPTGKIIGKIKDEQGVPLPGVSVQGESPKLVGKATAVTDDTGTYRLFSLPSGVYSITYSLAGFKTKIRKGINLDLAQTLTLNESLEQSALAEEVTVIGQSPLIDVKSTTKGSTIKKALFMALPKSRNFEGLLSTVPGVQYDANTGGLSVDGATGTENAFYIDGTNVSSIHIGTQSQTAIFEQVEEVKITASGYNAEFGGALGGVVNVITRSGGNEFHGDVIGYFNDNSLLMQAKARDYLRTNPYNDYLVEYVNNDNLYYNGGKDRDPTRRIEGVFDLGGFIIKDRLWFYGSFNPFKTVQEAQRWFTSDPVDLTKAKVPGDAKADPRQGRPTYGYSRKDMNYNWQAKLTAQPIKGLRLTASAVSNWRNYRGNIPAITGTGNKTLPWDKYGYDYPNLSGNITADYSASNNLLVSLRGGYFMTDTKNQQVFMENTQWAFGTSSSIYPEIPASLQHSTGWTSGPASSKTESNLFARISGNLDVTYYASLAGEHAVKFGLQYIRLRENVDAGYPFPMVTLNWGLGYYGLATGEPVLGKYGNYQIRGSWTSPYGNNWDIHSDNWAIYLQDSWTISDRFTLNLGLRTESEYIPSFATNDPVLTKLKPINFGFDKKIAPRVGVIYDVLGDSSLKVFGSFGVYYDVMKLYVAECVYGGFKWVTDYYELNDYDWTKIAASGKLNDRASQEAGGRYVGSMNWRIPAFEETDPNLKPVSKYELSFGAEKKLGEEVSVSARFIHKHLIRALEAVGLMTPQGELYYTANPSEGYGSPVSKGGKIPDKYWETPPPNWNYFGLNLALEKRFSNNWQGGLSYTWNRTTGCWPGLSSTDEGGRNSPNSNRCYDLWFIQYDLKGNPLHGVLPHDRPHYFKFYGSYSFPFGLTVGAVAYGRSGQPLTTTLNLNNIGIIYPNNRFDTGERLPFQYWLDFYAEYSLRLAKKYTVNINLNVSQIAPAIATAKGMTLNRDTIKGTDDELLTKTFDYMSKISTVTTGPTAPLARPSLTYGKVTSYMSSYTARIGARFSF